MPRACWRCARDSVLGDGERFDESAGAQRHKGRSGVDFIGGPTMVYSAKRWLLGGLATLLMAVSGGWGCDGESQWEHPNRERYPAPPAEDGLVMSLEELQQEWAHEDRRARQMETPTRQRRSTWTTLDLAVHHLRRAVDAAIEQTRRPAQSTEGEPVGGGPSSDNDRLHDDFSPPAVTQPVEPTDE